MVSALTRAAFLGAALFLSGADNASAQNTVYTPSFPNNQTAQQKAALKKTMCETSHIVIGDTQHNNPGIVAAVASADFMTAAQECGARHLFLELRVTGQKHIDALIAGTMTKDAYAKEMSKSGSFSNTQDPREIFRKWRAYADLIVNAHKAGMRVYASDPGGGMNEIMDAVTHYNMAAMAWRLAMPKELHPVIDEFIAGKPTDRWNEAEEWARAHADHPRIIEGNNLFAKGAELMDRGVALRTDVQLVKNIREIVSQKPGLSLILIGNGHAVKKDGVVNLLAPDVRWIVMTGSGSLHTKAEHSVAPALVIDARPFEPKVKTPALRR